MSDVWKGSSSIYESVFFITQKVWLLGNFDCLKKKFSKT